MRHQVAYIPDDERYVIEWTQSQCKGLGYVSAVHDFRTRDGSDAFTVEWQAGTTRVIDVVVHAPSPGRDPVMHPAVAIYG